MSELFNLVIITALAGVVGTGLGGVIGSIFKKDSNRTVSLLLSFAAGVMTSIVCFDLILDAIETKTNIFIIILTICVGVLVVYLLNYIIDKKTNSEISHIDKNHPKTADDLDEITHINHWNQHKLNKDTRSSLFVAGIVMVCAIALHNLPEGMTIGASFINTDSVLTGSSLALAILIGLHNIPEGMAVVVPLISGGMKKSKAIFITALSGAPTILGAVLGYLIGDVGPIGLALSLCFASGAMLYVVFGEILPQAILMHKSKLPTFSTIIGMMIGLLMIYL